MIFREADIEAVPMVCFTLFGKIFGGDVPLRHQFSITTQGIYCLNFKSQSGAVSSSLGFDMSYQLKSLNMVEGGRNGNYCVLDRDRKTSYLSKYLYQSDRKTQVPGNLFPSC